MKFLSVFAQSKTISPGRAVKRDGQTGELTVVYMLPQLSIFDIKGRLAVRRWKRRMKGTPLWL